MNSRHISLLLPEGAFLIAFYFCDVSNPGLKDDRVVIFCAKDRFLMFSDNDRCAACAGELDGKAEPFMQMLAFFNALTANDVYQLEKLEDAITDLEDSMLTDKKVHTEQSARIIRLRRELLKMKRYYEQLSLITEMLSENTEDVFSAETQKRYASLDRRADYLLNSVLHLREYITQVREAYQAQIDIEQNQIMKLFTVMTTVFLPLTLIVGWYGMNFDMPEYRWTLGYPFVIALSVAVCIVSIFFFKKRKWF